MIRERVKIELYNAQRATEILLKVKGSHEETIRRQYERGMDDLFTTIIVEFSREGVESVLDRLEQVLVDVSGSPSAHLRAVLSAERALPW